VTALKSKIQSFSRIFVVFALFLAISAIASAQRFGGSSHQAQKVSQQTTPPPAAQQPAGRQGGQSGQPQQNQFTFSWEWWKDEAVKKEMQLTPEQLRNISNLYDRRVRDMKPMDEAYQKERKELDKMSSERLVEVSVYSIQVSRVEALRTELFKTRTVMLYQIHRMLTPEQIKKLDEIRDRRRARVNRGGGPR
jgi:Spy/CpxP family protein refolding chaperone